MSFTPEEEDLIAKYSVPSVPDKPPSPIVTVLRWIAVLPAAVAAYCAIQLAIILMNATMREGHAEWFLQLINSFASAYAFVAVGSFTAPRYQYTVGIILGVTLVVAMTVLLYLAYWIETTEPWWWLALASIISIAGVVAALSQLREDKWQLK